MKDRICMVTGATSGIGEAAARTLAQMGATVIAVGRDPVRGAAALERIRSASGSAAVELMLADLSSLKDIRQLAQQFTSRYQRLHVLVNNAGALFTARQQSADGIEMTFALNHLNYFLLTNLLLDTLKASAPTRIVNVGASAHQFARQAAGFDDLQGQRKYSGWGAYGQSKLCNLLFTYELARRLDGTGVTVNALHPGIVATNFGMSGGGLMPLFNRLMSVAMLRPEQGAQTVVYLAASPEVEGVSGKYFVKQKAVRSSKASYDPSAAERLWQVSAAMCGLSA
ncbi:MAG: SDR family oxidoreductase [Chloroflexi bacterium]|nr:SDR family oxidoreductase [Chloroflexota bacterium]